MATPNLFEVSAKIGLDTSAYERGLSSASRSTSSFGDKLKSGFATAAKVAAAAIGAATAAVTAFAKSSLEVGKQFDSSMSQVAATMGITMDELNNDVQSVNLSTGEFTGTLRDFAQYMGGTTVFSASQAADALNYMALAGYDAKTSMEMLPNVLNLAAAGGIELAYASDMITDSQTALGLTLDETSVLVDQMAKAASESNTNVSQLGEAILTIGGTARFMSGGTKELSTVLGVLADNSIKGSEGGTHLRNILLKLASPTKEGQTAINALGLSIFDANGNMRSMQDIFSDLNYVLKNPTERIKELYEQLQGTEREASAASLAFSMLGIKAQIIDPDTGVVLGLRKLDDILGELNDGALKQSAQLEILSGIFNTRDVAAVTALMNTTVERWEELNDAITDSAGAAQAMADVQLDNLAGDITLFKSALDIAKITISDQLTPALRRFVQFGAKGVSELSEAFRSGGLSGALEALGKLLSEGLDMIIDDLPDFVDGGLRLLEAIGKGISDNKEKVGNAILTILEKIADTILLNLPGVVELGLKLLISLANGIADNLDELVPSVIKTITEIAKTLTDRENLDQIIEAALKIIKKLGFGLLDAISDPEFAQDLIDIVTGVCEALLDEAPQVIQTGIDLMGKLVDDIPKIVENIGNELPKLVEGIVDSLLENDNLEKMISGGIELFGALVLFPLRIKARIAEKIPEIVHGIFDLLTGKDSTDEMNSVGEEFLKQIWEGIKSGLGSFWENIKGLFGDIWGAVTSFFGGDDDLDMSKYTPSPSGRGGSGSFGSAEDLRFDVVEGAPGSRTKYIDNTTSPEFGPRQEKENKGTTIVVQSVLDGKVIGETAYDYYKRKQTAMGV